MVPHNSKSDLPLATLSDHMHKKFNTNWTKIKGGCQSGRKVVTYGSKADLPLIWIKINYPGVVKRKIHLD